MAFTNRYQKTIKGNMIQIGNTLGLSKANNALTPGTLGSIGAFITTQNLTAAGGWPNGTTLNFTQNSSSAILTLPTGAVVDYAELIWSASYVVNGQNLGTTLPNAAVNLTDSLGVVHSVSPTGINITGIGLSEGGENSTNYVNSANVTSIVNNSKSGTYTVGNVPCTMSATSNFLQYAGWSLYVMYTLDTAPVRNIILYVGYTVSVDIPYSVPVNYPGPPYPIRICYSVGEGDAIIVGDQFNTRSGTGQPNAVAFGTSVQPITNPFASIIGDQSGGIDTTGSFGTYNQNGIAGTNMIGGRQGWDIANNISLTSTFNGPATNLGLDIGTNNDPAIMVSNGFIVDLNQPAATLTKYVDKLTARSGDTLTYSIVYNFTTTPVNAFNTVVIDTVPSGVSFITGSVAINGVTQPNTVTPNPPGVSLGTVTTTTRFTVTYKATVNNVIQTTTIPNDAYGSYKFTTNATTFLNTNISNSILTTIDPFVATATKFVDNKIATIGDILTYTVTISNSGATLNNVIFRDTVPNNTSFIPNTVSINSVTQLGVLPDNVLLNTLNYNSIITVAFQVVVTTIPSPNPITNSANIIGNYTLDPSVPYGASQDFNTNIVPTTINTAFLKTTKQASKAFARVGDIISYTISILNDGSTTAYNILFIDTIPNDTTLVSGTFLQDTTTISGSSNPPGVTLPKSIGAWQRSTVTFSVTVNTIPSPNPISNSASQTYQFTIDSTTTPNRTGNSFANTTIVNTTVNNASLHNIVKGVDQNYAVCGAVLTYTITIPNSGNATATNVVFKDTIPLGTSFVTNSVTIDGVTAPAGTNPQTGILVGTIAAGSLSVVKFKVNVIC